MQDAHFDREVLQEFLLGGLDPTLNRRVVRHLLGGCERCQGVTGSLWQQGLDWEGTEESEDEDEGEDEIYTERLLQECHRRQAALDAEREEAVELFQELQRYPSGRQVMLVANCERFITWGFCQYLLERSWESRFDDVERTIELANLAVVLAEKLGNCACGPALAYDLRARSWAHLGNAYRIGSDYESSEEAFHEAERNLARGTGDCLEKARVLELKAYLKTDLSRFDEAAQLLDQAIILCRLNGDEHAVGDMLSQKGLVHGRSGEYETAIDLIRQGLELMEPKNDPRRYLAAKHNLVSSLQETGKLAEALSLLQEIRPLYAALGDRLQHVRLAWVEGRIALRLEDLDLAEQCFLEARQGFVEQQIGYDAAQVSLELAQVYASRGGKAEISLLAAQMVPIFDAQDMHQEAIAALVVFQDAAKNDAASLELIQGIVEYLEKAKDDPSLRYKPS